MLLETLKALPDQPITIGHAEDGNSNAIEIVSSYGKYHLVGDNPDDFPIISEDDAMETFSFECQNINCTGQSAFAVSNDEMRLAMTGVYMMIDYNKVVFVATDAHKLVKYTFGNVNTEISDSIILSRKLISLLKAALPGHGSVDISFNCKNAVFQFEIPKSSPN